LLVVDDEQTQRDMLKRILKRAGFGVETAADGRAALDLLQQDSFDLLLTDQRMPSMDGLELLEQAQRIAPRLPVVLMTAYGTVSTAVEAMKRGAADYLTKPFERDELLLVVDKAIRHRQLEDEVVSLHGMLKDRSQLDNIIGVSKPMQEIFSYIERVSFADVPVLITGESGTGKELVARAIHERSNRASGPFVALNCGAVPETLLETEFFGHERGAFTGAVRAHAGRFEQADGGTLFLDEIGTMRVDLQAKLLRALQEQEIQRLGSSQNRKVDVRILAATGEDLTEAIRNKAFREDLYYRLNVVPIHLPPLRDRREDIPLLIQHFLDTAARKFSREPPAISTEAMELFQAYSWPGNVRELENCMERLLVLSRGPRVTVDDLPANLRQGVDAAEQGVNGFELPAEGVPLTNLERHLIRQALRRCQGRIRPAARLLGISYKTMQYRIRKYGLESEVDTDRNGVSG
jgi:two-component system NtrC family response regulator